MIFINIELLERMAEGNKFQSALKKFWDLYSSVEIIVMTTQEKIRKAVMAVKEGADNYLTYPIIADEVQYVVDSIQDYLLMQTELEYLRDQFWQPGALKIIQTKSPVMKSALDNIRAVASTKSTVLFMGETGTGKGIMARLVHEHSLRSEGPFISVHCGAIPDTLIESELFGHEKGAFTGAVRRKLGKFEIAKNGTILLDEIGTVTPSAQVKLLQILQDGAFHRVGGEETIGADVRVIAATNSDLKKMCSEGQFRSDLFYRLNVFPIEIPPLRERLEDISHLSDVLLERLNRSYEKGIHDIAPEVILAFQAYHWPGNIREMENLIERAYILESSPRLTPASFPGDLFSQEASLSLPPLNDSMTLAQARRFGVEEIEKRYLHKLLSDQKGRIDASAEKAGITTRQLHKLLVKYGIRKEDYKSPKPEPAKNGIKSS